MWSSSVNSDAAPSRGIARAEERLLSAIAGGRVPHACFISCPDLLMAEAMARRAAALHCTGRADAGRLALTGDCIIPESYRAEDIRGITAELARSSFSGGGRAVLLANAHTMREVSQNILLKTLEEPPAGVLFLLTGNEAGLLPTILSRCTPIRCGLPTAEEVAGELMARGAGREEALLYARQGNTLERAARLYADEGCRALRRAAQDALLELLRGRLPFEGQKAIASAEGAHYMLSLMGDMLSLKAGGGIRENPDREPELTAICPRFTTGRIKVIIEALAETMERLWAGAPPQAAFTRLYTEITEEF